MKIRSIGAALTAALLALTVFTTPASADHENVASEQYGGSAGGRALSLSVLGNTVSFGIGSAGAELDTVNDQVDAVATGIGSVLAEETAVAAGMGESADGCAVPELGEIFGALDITVDLACGAASVAGAGTDFVATGTGQVAGLSIANEDVLAGLFDDPVLGPIFDEVFGVIETVEDTVDEIEETEDPVTGSDLEDAVDLLNDTLADLFGEGNVVIPDLDVSDTLGNLVDRLTSTRIVDASLGSSTNEVDSGAAGLTSTSTDAGGVVEVLPGFWPNGDALVRIVIGESAATVSYDRNSTAGSGSSKNMIVRVESQLLPTLNLGQIPVPGGVPGLGGSLPFADFVDTVGYAGGPGYVELSPGQSLSLFCDGEDAGLTGGALCTEISVGMPSESEEDGRLKVDASSVTIDVAKGLGDLLAGAGLPTSAPELPRLPDIEGLLPQLPDIGVGDVTDIVNGLLEDVGGLADVPGTDEGLVNAASTGSGGSSSGIRIEVAGASAEAGGAKVMGKSTPEPDPDTPPTLPRPDDHTSELPKTGGPQVLGYGATALLGLGAGLRTLVRRRQA